MTHTTSIADLLPGSASIGMFECQRLNSALASLSSEDGNDTYADIFKAQAETSTEFAKMLSAAQQSLNKPFLEEFAY
ncbi:hypothetical protein B5M06_14915 [Comamonas kerstersii]|uniref:Uncharacterized protein n=1 Tax=Comamonas kerstersii TaxID=225992 RepID=A0A1V0BHC5_9BURK|nr:hypothetical protein [Comamonas kerstersii]AQZ99349.1 hypothetical protein B5M06_14915 [Comamonas kerstersii]